MKKYDVKKNGFTLVELLVVMVILGIIMLLCFPVIRKVSYNLENSKFNTYKNSLESSAKVYISDYSEDLFGRNKSGCAYISLSSLIKRGLAKDVEVSDYSCNNDNSFIKVIKVDDQYSYTPYLYCKNKQEASVILPSADTPYTMDDSCNVTNTTSISVSASPTSNTSIKNKVSSSSIIITSRAGINIDVKPKITYAWTLSNDNYSNLKFTSVNFPNIPSKSEQASTLLSDLPVTVKSSKIFTPSGQTGDYYLIIRIDKIMDYNGNYWTSSDGSNYMSFGPFRVDNTPPTIDNTTKVVSSNSNYNNDSPILQLTASDNYTKAKDLKVCVSYTNNSCTSWQNYSTSINLDKISNVTYNGTSYDVYVYVKDLAGNITNQKFTYKVYNECQTTANLLKTTVKTQGICSKRCGSGTRTDVYYTKDKYTNNDCPSNKTINETNVACNTGINCCSESNIDKSVKKQDPSTVNGKWSSCSKYCGGGTKTRKVTTTYYYGSKLDSTETCPVEIESTESADCNTKKCNRAIMIYKITGSTAKCDNNPPERDYADYSEYYCQCKWSSRTGKLTSGNYRATETTNGSNIQIDEWNGITKDTKITGHGSNTEKTTMKVYYKNNDNGIAACKKEQYSTNSYVDHICEIYYGTRQEYSTNNIMFTHGYIWFKGKATITGYKSTDFWNHGPYFKITDLKDGTGADDLDFEKWKIWLQARVSQTTATNKDAACKATCELLWGETYYDSNSTIYKINHLDKDDED